MGVAGAGQLRLEWVTSDEQSVLEALRTSLSDMNFARGVQPGENIIREKHQVLAETKKNEPVAPSEDAGAVAIDDILTLLEIGQRALSGEGIVIQKQK